LLQGFAIIVGLGLIGVTLVDGFCTVVLPRRVRRAFRLTGAFYRFTWSLFAAAGRRIGNGARREEYLSVYGPLSFLTLLVCWALFLIAGFGLLQWAAAPSMRLEELASAIYTSASALFMLTADVHQNTFSRWLVTIEAGVGFGFLGLVVGYLPVLYQSYSSREVRISLLDARAGSPPSAGELVLRQSKNPDKVEKQLADWEEWMAELLEEHLSYPMLAYFRSQHQNQSWLAALTAMLDATVLVALGSDGDLKRQAQLTFAIGRHALVDLATVFRAKPQVPPEDRLPSSHLGELCTALGDAKSCLQVDRVSPEKLAALRGMYEPYAYSLSVHFLFALPEWRPKSSRDDNWLATSEEHNNAKFAVSDPFRD